MRASSLRIRHVLYAVLGLVGIQVAGIAGFAVLLDEGPLDAFYRTIVLVSTVGLDSVPSTGAAKAFSIVIIVSGAALLLYVVGLVVELTVTGIVSGAWQERRLRRTVETLEGHSLVCGYGRVGRCVADEFRAAGVRYVVVDEDPAAVAEARERGDAVVEASATDDDALERAGIARARGLVACVDTDPENLYIVLSARGVRPDLLIVARASSEDAAKKLRRGGADRVISPYQTAGRELATLVLKPQVSAFLDVVTGGESPEFRFQQVEVSPACGRAGRSIRDLRVREVTGAMVIAHKAAGGQFNTRPDPDAVLGEGDVLIAVGTAEEIRALEDLFRPREAVA